MARRAFQPQSWGDPHRDAPHDFFKCLVRVKMSIVGKSGPFILEYGLGKHKARPLRTGSFFGMAEREGFEPSVPLFGVHSLSRRAPSADSAISPDDACCGGGSRIRTHGPASNRPTVFKTAALNHSAIPPWSESELGLSTIHPLQCQEKAKHAGTSTSVNETPFVC